MRRFSLAVVRQRRAIIVLSVLLCAVSIFAMLNVRVNYDLASYLPKDAPSTKAMGLVGDDVPNLKVYVPGVSLSQAVNAKAAIAASPHVKRVLWLDDTMDLRGRPEETIPEEALVPWYQEGGALYQVAIDSTDYTTGYSDIKGLFPDAIMAGDAANQATVISVSMREVARIIPFILPIVIFILLFATRHWFEPVLFLLSILVAILLNEGSNVFWALFRSSPAPVRRCCSWRCPSTMPSFCCTDLANAVKKEWITRAPWWRQWYCPHPLSLPAP